MSTKKKSIKRRTWNDYGISEQRYNQLSFYCRDRENYRMVCNVANKTDKMIAPWIIKSVCNGLSYDKLEYTSKMGRIPCGRTDFYGYRRLFYSLLDEELGNHLKEMR